MENEKDGTNETLTPGEAIDAPKREIRWFRCLKCNDELYRLGQIADGWALIRGSPEMYFEGDDAYMFCPHCGAKNGFTEVSAPAGQRGYRRTHLMP